MVNNRRLDVYHVPNGGLMANMKHPHGLFEKGPGHISPEMKAKIRAGIIRHYAGLPKLLSPKEAALEEKAQANLKLIKEELAWLRNHLSLSSD
jgi:hypothetical protein